MYLYNYGIIISKANDKLNKLMREYHYDNIDETEAEKQAYYIVKDMEEEIYNYEHYQQEFKFTKEMKERIEKQ